MSIQIERLGSVLDRSGPVPLYHQLQQWVGNRILCGDLPPGAQLPNELEICDRLGVSRGVVRQALAGLTHDGLVERRRGKGTFVATPKTAVGLIGGLRGLADDAAMRGQTVNSKVLALREVPASEVVARSLNLTPGDPAVELERLRALDGQPHVLVVTYLPAVLVPGLVKRDLNGPASLYRVLREEYELPIVSCVRRVEATVARTREGQLLGIRRGAPLLALRNIGYTTGARPLDYFVALHRGDHTAFEVELTSALGAAARFTPVPADHRELP